MDKTYTFKHVIFGLREEYLKIEKELNELKKYVDVSRDVSDYHFSIAGGMYSNPGVVQLVLTKRKNLIEKILGKMKLLMVFYKSYDLTNEVKDAYHYRNKQFCSINNQDELSKRIKEILETDYFMNMVANKHFAIPCLENKNNSLLITHGIIDVFRGKDLSAPHFSYLSRNDEFEVLHLEKIITPDDINKLLNLSLNGSYLNDYHRNILDNYEEKELDIYDFAEKGCFKLDIIEEPKKLILKPKNIKH